MLPGDRTSLSALGAGILLALLLLFAGHQIAPTGWYSAAPAYRAQVAALLDGHLALSHAPEAIFHDFAWTPSGVQQVWGLGVPLWQLPFAALGRLVGVSPFPDRVALLAWLVLVFTVTIRAWWRRDTGECWWIGAGSILIVALLPAFVALVRGRLGVYEEAALYSYTAAIVLLGGLRRVEDCRWRLLVLCAAAGLVGFIRPTIAVYGLATVVVACGRWLVARGRRGLVEVAIGGVLFAAGGGALYATNAARFGDGLEFGHRLNLQSLPGNLYATRFSYPMQRAGLGEASLELVTSLFDRPERQSRGGFFEEDLHVGVSDRPRWREYYFTTFSWPYAPLLLAAIVIGIRRRRHGDTGWLLLWAGVALVPLVAFYLRAPFFSSRYQLDLAPAFAVLLVIGWRELAAWRPHRALPIVLLALWTTAVVTSTIARRKGATPVSREAATRAMEKITTAVAQPRTLPGAYDLADLMLPAYTDLQTEFLRCNATRCLRGTRPKDSQQWSITDEETHQAIPTAPALYLNLYRWNLENGLMPPASYAFVDDPRFVELDVTVDEGAVPADWSREVQVAVGLQHLRLVATTPSPYGTRLRFEASRALPGGLQVAYFAFGPDDELARPMSRIHVRRIAWR